MSKKTITLSWSDIHTITRALAKELYNNHTDHYFSIYGVPRGGWNVAIYLLKVLSKEYPTAIVHLVETPEKANIIVDDLIDSGATKSRYETKYPNTPFYTLLDKKTTKNLWVIFPWEHQTETGPEDNVRRVIEYIGDDPNREGLLETPKRVIKAYDYLFSGYDKDPKDIIKVFEDGACDEMVLLKDIEFYSCCEHHMIPFSGKAHIAYIPDGKVIGVSKLARLLEIYARRLQIQERIGMQVTQALDEMLECKGSACILEAQHMCMTSRGVEKQNSVMVTSSLTGVFREDSSTRAELLSIINR